MNETKIQFSVAEAELMCNAEILLTKNRVIEKVKFMLEHLQNDLVNEQMHLTSPTMKDVFDISPKISKGENYEGLPYLILDYPRSFARENIFAVRTMFWWGNFFSITLHLSGHYKQQYINAIKKAAPLLKENNFYIGIHQNPWLHHFEPGNYEKITDDLNKFHKQLNQAEHLKIAAKMPVAHWHSASAFLFEHWKILIAACRH